MEKPSPSLINLPPMSDDSVVEFHRCLGALIDAFESAYGFQLWCYYNQHPEHERPVKFRGKPF